MSAKAYEIVPVIENISLPTSQSKVECMECSGKNMYVGFSDSFITKYSYDLIKRDNGNPKYTCTKELTKLLDSKKPVRTLKAASALGKLLAVCDTTLIVLSMEDLEPINSSARLKNVNLLCVNENSNLNDPFCVQICVASPSKGQVGVYNVTAEHKLLHISTVNLAEPVSCLSADGSFICAGLRSKYVMVNFEKNQVQDLFPFSTGNFSPIVCRVSKEEFLLSGPDGLGMFVTAGGVTNRPPLQWSYPLISVTFHHPYILGLSNEIIMVHSIVNQQQVQAVFLVGGNYIDNFEGQIFVQTASALHCLTPVPWEKQVEMLLADERVEEAMSLTEKVGQTGHLRDHVDQMKRRFKTQAAFIYFARADMERALELFLEGQVDEREIIAIFPGLLPSSSNFVRAIPPLSKIADVINLFHGDYDKILFAKQFLLHFLQMSHEDKSSLHAVEVDTALVKLYSELEMNDELEKLLISETLSSDYRDCSSWLEKRGCHHALATLCLREGKTERALSIWSRIISGELNDSLFEGLECFVEILSRVSEAELVWRYADIVLDRDEVIGVRMFTSPPSSFNYNISTIFDQRGTPSAAYSLNPSTVVDYLQRYPRALIRFLEFIVYEKDVKEEKFHTQLSVQYLDRISHLQQDQSQKVLLDETRSALRRFLTDSNYYRASLLIPKVLSFGLDHELAVLYGKTGEHDKALDILVHKLKDFNGAEDYCVRNGTGQSDSGHNPLLLALLTIYLNPKLKESEREHFIVPALDILNKYAEDLDAVKVIEMIPSDWSIGILESFLSGAFRSSLHRFRMSKIESSLAKGDSIQQGFTLYSLQRHSMTLHESNYCCVCKKPFTDGKFAWYPNDVVTHVECARLNNVCPLTGHLFTTLNAVPPGR